MKLCREEYKPDRVSETEAIQRLSMLLTILQDLLNAGHHDLGRPLKVRLTGDVRLAPGGGPAAFERRVTHL